MYSINSYESPLNFGLANLHKFKSRTSTIVLSKEDASLEQWLPTSNSKM